MDNLTPITKKERLLAGEDLDPVTRFEYFLKKAGQGGGGGFTPTQAQLDAMNSGIDSTKVAQIATNTSDISGIQDTIGDINSVLEEVL